MVMGRPLIPWLSLSEREQLDDGSFTESVHAGTARRDRSSGGSNQAIAETVGVTELRSASGGRFVDQSSSCMMNCVQWRHVAAAVEAAEPMALATRYRISPPVSLFQRVLVVQVLQAAVDARFSAFKMAV